MKPQVLEQLTENEKYIIAGALLCTLEEGDNTLDLSEEREFFNEYSQLSLSNYETYEAYKDQERARALLQVLLDSLGDHMKERAK